jgi:hypothetical protein
MDAAAGSARRLLLRMSLVTALLAAVITAPSAGLDRGVFFFSGLGHAELALGGDVPALTAFDVRYTNGDHHLTGIGVHPAPPWDDEQDLNVDLWDGSVADEPFAGTIRWADVRAFDGVHQAEATNCAGTCRVPMPSLPQGQIFVLLGFIVQFRDGDHHIQEISVDPHPYSGYIEVKFTDSSGTRPYMAFIQYASLPYYMELDNERLSSTSPAYGTAITRRLPGLAVLRGFRLRFTNGDHHLYRMAVDLWSASSLTLRFRDSNTDDPFVWSVDYVILRE